MTRLARVLAVGVPHHVTQRRNARSFILDGGADRRVYLDLMRQSLALHSLALIGYGLMSTHVRTYATGLGKDLGTRLNTVPHSQRTLTAYHFDLQDIDE